MDKIPEEYRSETQKRGDMDMDTEQGAVGGAPQPRKEKAMDSVPGVLNPEPAKSSPEPNVKGSVSSVSLHHFGEQIRHWF